MTTTYAGVADARYAACSFRGVESKASLHPHDLLGAAYENPTSCYSIAPQSSRIYIL